MASRWKMFAVALSATLLGCGDGGAGPSPDAGLPPGVNVPPDGAFYRLEVVLVSGDGCPVSMAWPGTLADSVATSERCAVSGAMRAGDSVSAAVDCPGPYNLNHASAHLDITATWADGVANGQAAATIADDFGAVCAGTYDVRIAPANDGDTAGAVEWAW